MKFIVNYIKGRMCLPLDVDLQEMDWDELPTSQSELYPGESRARLTRKRIPHGQSDTAMGIVHAMISDAGRTELAPGTVTALAVGPAEDKAVDRITGSIPLLR